MHPDPLAPQPFELMLFLRCRDVFTHQHRPLKCLRQVQQHLDGISLVLVQATACVSQLPGQTLHGPAMPKPAPQTDPLETPRGHIIVCRVQNAHRQQPGSLRLRQRNGLTQCGGIMQTQIVSKPVDHASHA
jgi:hypothetical protein